MYQSGNIIHFRENNKIKKGSVMTVSTINRGRTPTVLFYVVKNSNSNAQQTVYPNQVISSKNYLNTAMKSKVNFQELKNSIMNIQELRNLPSNVRKLILEKINRKLRILNT